MATTALSDDHKKAMADGRRMRNTVDKYLRALDEIPKQQRRQKAAEDSKERLEELAGQIEEAAGVERLHLLQEREDLIAKTTVPESGIDVEALEAGFVKVAAAYGEKNGISYSTWRELGVPKTVLEAAGVKRTRRPNKKK